jgi:uncharacterized protein (UPF0332 family)
MKKSKEYYNQGDKYLEAAECLLKSGDYLQASEKFWGAATQFVKSVAEDNGWKHDGHANLFKVINDLSRKTGDKEYNTFFSSASSLHINFYEHWFQPEQVEQYADDVRKLIVKLKQKKWR